MTASVAHGTEQRILGLTERVAGDPAILILGGLVKGQGRNATLLTTDELGQPTRQTESRRISMEIQSGTEGIQTRRDSRGKEQLKSRQAKGEASRRLTRGQRGRHRGWWSRG